MQVNSEPTTQEAPTIHTPSPPPYATGGAAVRAAVGHQLSAGDAEKAAALRKMKMVALGLPDFRPVQNNMSYNARAGTTRGFHAEPWDKLVSVAHGRVFGAWVDLRAGPTFGQQFVAEAGPDTAVFVPRGVANESYDVGRINCGRRRSGGASADQSCNQKHEASHQDLQER